MNQLEEHFLASIIEHSTDSIVSVDIARNITSWNKAAEDLYGYRAEEVVGKPLEMLSAKNGFNEVVNTLEKVLEGEATEVFNTLRVRKGGKVICVSVKMSPVKDEVGNIIGASTISRDVTEQIRSRDELRKTEGWRSILFEQVKDIAIFSMDQEGIVTDWNPGAEGVIGFKAHEILGKPGAILFEPKDREAGIPEKEMNDALKNGCALDERWHLRKDGQRFFATGALRPLWTEEGEHLGFVKVVRDITPRKQHEEVLQSANTDLEDQIAIRTRELSVSNEELTRSNKELEAFAYIASHDLQEPLRMVKSYVQLLQHSLNSNEFTDQLEEFSGYIVEGVERMQSLINDLLSYSRIRAKPLDRKKRPLEDLLEDAVKNLRVMIHETKGKITWDTLPQLNVDGSQMIQLFQNLLSNALKFRREEPPRIHISAIKESDAWKICVTDNGIGIEPQYHDKIFQLFQRLNTREQFPGTGLGLAICKLVVERHGGKIWLESPDGRGSVFCFILPE